MNYILYLGGGGCDIGGALVNACAFKLEVVVTEAVDGCEV